MNASDDDEFTIVFSEWPAEFRQELEAALTADDAEIAESQGFGGELTMKVIAFGAAALSKLADFLVAKKKTEGGRKIKVKIGTSEVSLEGFGGDDVKEMLPVLIELTAELKAQNAKA